MLKETIKLVNTKTNEVFFCKDFRNIKEIDGRKFIEVAKDPNGRFFLMNKDVFVKAKK